MLSGRVAESKHPAWERNQTPRPRRSLSIQTDNRPEQTVEGVTAVRDTFVQETGLEFVLSILGAGVGAFASFFLAFFVLRPFDVDYGLDVMAFLAMFLGAPAGSLLGMSLVGKVVHRSWSCSWRALIFTFVACDLALAVLRIMPPGDSGTFAGPEFLFLIAGVCAFLGYKLSGIKRAESRHPTTDTIGTDTIGTDPRSPE